MRWSMTHSVPWRKGNLLRLWFVRKINWHYFTKDEWTSPVFDKMKYVVHFKTNNKRRFCSSIILSWVHSYSSPTIPFRRTGVCVFFIFVPKTNLSLTPASSRANSSDTSLVESTRLCTLANSLDLLSSVPSSTNDFSWLVSWTRSDFTSYNQSMRS